MKILKEIYWDMFVKMFKHESNYFVKGFAVFMGGFIWFTSLLLIFVFGIGIFATINCATAKSYYGGTAVVVDEWTEYHCSKGCYTNYYIRAKNDSIDFVNYVGEDFYEYTGIGDSVNIKYRVGGIDKKRDYSITDNFFHLKTRK